MSLLLGLTIAASLSSACSTSVRFGGQSNGGAHKDTAASDGGGGGNGNGYDGKITHVTRGECHGLVSSEKSALSIGGARPLLMKENCQPLDPAREIDPSEIEPIEPGGRVLAWRGTIFDKKSAVATEQLVTIAACRARTPQELETLVWTKAGDPSRMSGELYRLEGGKRVPASATGTLGVKRRYDLDSGLEILTSETGPRGEFFELRYLTQAIELSFRLPSSPGSETAAGAECLRQEAPRVSINVVSRGDWYHRKAGGRR